MAEAPTKIIPKTDLTLFLAEWKDLPVRDDWSSWRENGFQDFRLRVSGLV